MSTLRFRAWDTDQKTFVFFSFDDPASMGRFWGSDGLRERGSFTYQQSTGLTDKHGKEIYDHDILREDLRRLYVAAWFDHGWALQEVGSPQGGYRHFKDAQHMEIIGTTDEQPEVVQRQSGRVW